MKENQHFKNCSAPICNCDPNTNYKDEVVWCPGESVCKNKPYKKFQEQQILINDLVRKKKFKAEGSFSANQLEAYKISKTGKFRSKQPKWHFRTGI